MSMSDTWYFVPIFYTSLVALLLSLFLQKENIEFVKIFAFRFSNDLHVSEVIYT